MISFSIPTDNLESAISALMAELHAKQEALKVTKKLEKQATSTIQKLADTVEALKAMPEQLEALKASVTALFPQPEPAPVDDATPDEPLPCADLSVRTVGTTLVSPITQILKRLNQW